jgi:hypothetical protein
VKRKTVGRKRPALGALRASHVPISYSSLGGLGTPFLWNGAAVENRELTGEVEFNDFLTWILSTFLYVASCPSCY